MHLTSHKVADSELLLSLWYVSIQTRQFTMSVHSRDVNADQGLLMFAILVYRSKTDLRTKGARMVKGWGNPNKIHIGI
jgi:hypothetical protein